MSSSCVGFGRQCRNRSCGMSADKDVVISIPQGKLQGKKDKSAFGTEFYAFHQIPYAKPPVGDLRFQPPQPAEGWKGVRDATKEGAICPSLDMTKTNYLPESSEDSLFINVFCKQNPNTVGSKKYPVMVWLHPGGFEFGSGNRFMSGPDFLLLHDVLLVTLNYRLGALGFLSLQTVECPGNYGLKDQVLALKWVQNNIGHFGGDADNVTIFGLSAGAASVQYLTMMPSVRGLFKRVIAQSGSSMNHWAYSRYPRESAFLLGKRLGCDTKDDKELLDFLKKASAKDIVMNSTKIITEIEGEYIGENFLNLSFVPTVEPEHDGAVLTQHPWILLKEGKYLDLPYITGVCEREMILGVTGKDDYPRFTNDEEFQALLPKDVKLEKNSPRALEAARRLRSFFFKDGINLDNYIDALSDIFFNYGVLKVVKSRTTNKDIKSPTYLYRFSYQGDQIFIKEMLGLTDIEGVAHGGDGIYLFHTAFTKEDKMSPGSRDYDVMNKMTKLWVNFATDGVPYLNEPPLTWQGTSFPDLGYLDMGEKFQMKKELMKDRLEVWDEIYASYYDNL